MNDTSFTTRFPYNQCGSAAALVFFLFLLLACRNNPPITPTPTATSTPTYTPSATPPAPTYTTTPTLTPSPPILIFEVPTAVAVFIPEIVINVEQGEFVVSGMYDRETGRLVQATATISAETPTPPTPITATVPTRQNFTRLDFQPNCTQKAPHPTKSGSSICTELDGINITASQLDESDIHDLVAKHRCPETHQSAAATRFLALSDGYTNATSAQAHGIAHIEWSTWSWRYYEISRQPIDALTNPYDPSQNIQIACFIMRESLRSNGDPFWQWSRPTPTPYVLVTPPPKIPSPTRTPTLIAPPTPTKTPALTQIPIIQAETPTPDVASPTPLTSPTTEPTFDISSVEQRIEDAGCSSYRRLTNEAVPIWECYVFDGRTLTEREFFIAWEENGADNAVQGFCRSRNPSALPNAIVFNGVNLGYGLCALEPHEYTGIDPFDPESAILRVRELIGDPLP